MNRRNFIGSLLAVGAGFTVLPPATTYERVWRAVRPGMVFNAREFTGKWSFIEQFTSEIGTEFPLVIYHKRHPIITPLC